MSSLGPEGDRGLLFAVEVGVQFRPGQLTVWSLQAAPARPRSLLEMKVLRPHPGLANSLCVSHHSPSRLFFYHRGLKMQVQREDRHTDWAQCLLTDQASGCGGGEGMQGRAGLSLTLPRKAPSDPSNFQAQVSLRGQFEDALVTIKSFPAHLTLMVPRVSF